MLQTIAKTIAQAIVLAVILLLAGCSWFHSDPIANSDGKLYTAAPGTANLWLLLGKDLKMDHYSNNPDVQARITWYMQNTSYLERVAKRASPYMYFVLQEVKLRKMPSEIALLPVVESSYDPFAYSVSGAAGLWQMMPGTASGFSVRQNWWYDGRRDIYASTLAALDYLEYLHTYFNNDWYLALAAYNSGEGTVSNAVKINKTLGKPTDFWSLQLPEQTRQYVPKLMAISTILANPNKYLVNWPQTDMQPFFAVVKIGNQIDLDMAAKLADTTPEELRLLNPGFNQWATDPNGEHELMIPVEKVSIFEENLAALPKTEFISWNRYTVKPNDNMQKIARHFKTSPQIISQINNIKNNVLRTGQILLIPVETKVFSKETLSSIKHYLNYNSVLPGPNRVNYTVQKGDTLAKICKKYNITEQSLCYWNQIKRNEILEPGRELTLWTKQKMQSYDSVRLRPYTVNYTVKEHETLSEIAKQFNVTTTAIKQTNHLKSNAIKVGQPLVIPPSVHRLSNEKKRPKTYQVQAGDSVIGIAKKFNVTPTQLKTANHLKNNTIKIKQVLIIPTKTGG